MSIQNKPILFIFSGLPATGKSTLSKSISQKHKAIYIRIDTIEQGMKDFYNVNVQGEGYGLAYRIAADNLKLGLNVVADSCNPIEMTRTDWEQIALTHNSDFINIEIICSDEAEHKKRVESRVSDIKNLTLPDWKKVKNREYHKWGNKRIVIDTAHKSIETCERELNRRIEDTLSKRFIPESDQSPSSQS